MRLVSLIKQITIPKSESRNNFESNSAHGRLYSNQSYAPKLSSKFPIIRDRENHEKHGPDLTKENQGKYNQSDPTIHRSVSTS